MREVAAVVMRGGTSRGPVILADSLPSDRSGLDAAVLSLVGGGAVQTDALGGGTPTTSKLVVVKPVEGPEGLCLDYAVGNVVVGDSQVDWSGTCGNMTATVPLYALEQGIIDSMSAKAIRMRNMSTNGIVLARVAGADQHQRGSEALITTEYLEPGGAIFDSVLPSGSGLDHIVVEGVTYQASVVDVTHPYLFLWYDEVVGNQEIGSAQILSKIERIRAEVCVRLGVVPGWENAARIAPSTPRVILVRRGGAALGSISIHAISMGQAIASVPVTAAICMAAAAQIPSTIPALVAGLGMDTSKLTVNGPSGKLDAFATVGKDGHIVSAGVDRTVRTIMQGTTWI